MTAPGRPAPAGRALHVTEAPHQRGEATEQRPRHQHQQRERSGLEQLKVTPLTEIWVRSVFHAGVERSPSNDTDTSSRSTNVTRLTCASNGTRRPPPKPRVPSAPKRNQPSRPQVAKSTENSSPRSVHACAPNSSPAAALTSAYTQQSPRGERGQRGGAVVDQLAAGHGEEQRHRRPPPQPSRPGHDALVAEQAGAQARAGRTARASAAKGFTARVQSPMIPQLIGVATHTASQKNDGRMFSATDCEPIQPHTIRPTATSPATIQRTGAGRAARSGRRTSLRRRSPGPPRAAAPAGTRGTPPRRPRRRRATAARAGRSACRMRARASAGNRVAVVGDGRRTVFTVGSPVNEAARLATRERSDVVQTGGENRRRSAPERVAKQQSRRRDVRPVAVAATTCARVRAPTARGRCAHSSRLWPASIPAGAAHPTSDAASSRPIAGLDPCRRAIPVEQRRQPGGGQAVQPRARGSPGPRTGRLGRRPAPRPVR